MQHVRETLNVYTFFYRLVENIDLRQSIRRDFFVFGLKFRFLRLRTTIRTFSSTTNVPELAAGSAKHVRVRTILCQANETAAIRMQAKGDEFFKFHPPGHKTTRTFISVTVNGGCYTTTLLSKDD